MVSHTCRLYPISFYTAKFGDSSRKMNVLRDPATDPTSAFLDKLKDDVQACDFLISLAVAAANSYRFDSVFRPYPQIPPASAEETSEEVHNRLRHMLGKVPPLQSILADDELEREETLNFLGAPEIIQLLNWILSPSSFVLRSAPRTAFEKVKKLTGQLCHTQSPTHVFQLEWNEAAETQWRQRMGPSKSFYAYHGSRLENFHSILRLGLHQHLNQNSLYGEGTYLSCELSVCFTFSPNGFSWSNSMLGDTLSCVAVCEVIDREGVKSSLKAGAKDLPEKYFIVSNNDLLRVQYILVYAAPSFRKISSAPAYLADQSHDQALNQVENNVRPSLCAVGLSWMQRHRFVIFIGGYVCFLLVVGFLNSKAGSSFMKKLMRWK